MGRAAVDVARDEVGDMTDARELQFEIALDPRRHQARLVETMNDELRMMSSTNCLQ